MAQFLLYCGFINHGVDFMPRKKSSFYHTRWNRCGLNQERAAKVIGCTVEDVERFDIEGAQIAERLLYLWDSKHVGVEGWDGFLFSRGVLRFKKRQWTAASLLMWCDQEKELMELKSEIYRLKTWQGLCTVFVDKVVNWYG